MRIHAYRRKEPITVDLTPIGQATKELIRFKQIGENPPVIVADVDNERHIKALLRVPEAYREYNPDNLDAPSVFDPAAAGRLAEQARRQEELRQAEERRLQAEAEDRARTQAQASGTLIGSSIQPSTIDLTGSKNVPLGEVVEAAHRASGLSMEEWNELQGEEREAKIVQQIEVMTREAEQAEEDEREALAEQMRKEAADKAAAEKAQAEAAAAAKFTLIGPDKSVIDLKKMDDAALRDFAKKYEVEVPPKTKGDALRQFLVDTLVVETDEQKAAQDLNEQKARDAAGDKA